MFDPRWLRPGIDNAWQATKETVLKSHRLLLNGTDFSTPHPEMMDMVRHLDETSEDREFISARLEDYAQKLHELVDKSTLRMIKGELRDGPASECSANALATRAYLKQLNKRVQNLILRKAEPLCASLLILGKPYPTGFFDVAWKYMLQSHAHDSINGVTQDKTADDVEHRLKQAEEIAQVVYDAAVAKILKLIDLSCCSKQDAVLVVFNPLPRATREIIKACVVTPQESAAWSLTAADCDGDPVAVQEIARDERSFPVYDLEARPWPFHADRHTCYLDTGQVPAGGYKVIKIVAETLFDRDRFYWLEMQGASARIFLSSKTCWRTSTYGSRLLRMGR